MLRTLVTVALVWLSGSRCFSQSTAVADWLLTHALHGNADYKVLAQRTVDVTFDGKPETLIAFEDKTDRTAPVPFFIVGTTSRQHPTVLFRNDDVVDCQQCGGIFTDRGSFAVNSRGVITFSGQYGSRQRGYHFLSLRFDLSSKRWLVWAAGYNWYDSVDPTEHAPGAVGEWCFYATDLPRAIGADSTIRGAWDAFALFKNDGYYQVIRNRVKLAKTCRYDESPNVYLGKGAVVESCYKFGDNIACEYTIKNKRIRGLIPESALTKLVVSELGHEEYAVTVPKAHFYAAPNSTARLGLFVLKGDSLNCPYKVKGYTYCSFEKESHDTVNTLYYGFFRDEALTEKKRVR